MGHDPLIGKVLHDSHRIVRLIGTGGMGAVYEATHVRLKKQRFAIKVLHAEKLGNEKILTRFQREAEIATEIGHPNIVSVTDFYETEEGQPCMVMEFLAGEDLGVTLSRDGKLPVPDVIDIVRQVGSALEAVHQQGVVHRDLKPANIFMVATADGRPKVKVLDFGISKIRDSGLTGEDAVLGTPHYMSPEQGAGSSRDVDRRTDVFALGTICYQMLTGKLPFDGATLPAVIRKICTAEPEPVSSLAPELPSAVDPVFARALTKSRDDRYQQAVAFAADLGDALESEAEDELDMMETVALDGGSLLDGATIMDDSFTPGPVEQAPVQEALPANPNITNVLDIEVALYGEAPAEEVVVAPAPPPEKPPEPATPPGEELTRPSRSPSAEIPSASRVEVPVQRGPGRRSVLVLAGVALVALLAGVALTLMLSRSGQQEEPQREKATAPVTSKPAPATKPAEAPALVGVPSSPPAGPSAVATPAEPAPATAPAVGASPPPRAERRARKRKPRARKKKRRKPARKKKGRATDWVDPFKP